MRGLALESSHISLMLSENHCPLITGPVAWARTDHTINTPTQAGATLKVNSTIFGNSLIRITALLVLLGVSTVTAAQTSGCFTGYAYTPEDNSLAFTARYVPEPENPNSEGRARHWRVTYRGAGNEVLARKKLDFSWHDFVPVFTKRLTGSDHVSGIRRDAQGNWQMFKQNRSSGEIETETFEITPQMVADNGIHPFIQGHFAQLMAGETVRFKLVLAARKRIVDMRIDRIEDRTIDGQPAVRFRAQVDMLMVNWFTQKLVFTYNQDNQELLVYRGVSNLQDAQGDAYPVNIRYFQGEPPASVMALPAAAACPDRLSAKLE